ncbi:ABC transporter permease [Archangium gephyra]|nr:ABC transporter permease [Archangium gephyra]
MGGAPPALRVEQRGPASGGHGAHRRGLLGFLCDGGGGRAAGAVGGGQHIAGGGVGSDPGDRPVEGGGGGPVPHRPAVRGEAAFIGLSGGLIGALAGLWMGVLITDVVGGQATGWSFPYIFPARLAVAMGVVSTLCAILAGLYPARRAATLDVVEALAYE